MLINNFKNNNDIQIINNVNIFSEGIDIKMLDMIVYLEKKTSTIQII